MNSLFLIFNHRLTQIRKDDARAVSGIERIVNLPLDLEKIWRQIPSDLTEINGYLEAIKTV